MGNKSKKSLADLSHDLDLVMPKDDMTKIFGGSSVSKGGRSTWNSCGGIVPQ